MSVACKFGTGPTGGNQPTDPYSYVEGTLTFNVAPGGSATKVESISDVDNTGCLTQVVATYNDETVTSTEIGLIDGCTLTCSFSDGAKLVTVAGAKGADPVLPYSQQLTVTFSLPA